MLLSYRHNRRLPYALVCSLIVIGTGCSNYSGPSEYEQKKQAKQSFMDEVAAQGGRAEEKLFTKYGKSGKAWSIDLSGATVNDDMIESMTALGHVAELNLSKSSITDEQLIRFDERELGRLVLKLDLSHTAITDAALAELDNFYVLEHLILKGAKVTPQGVERFKKAQQSNPKVLAPFKNPKVEL